MKKINLKLFFIPFLIITIVFSLFSYYSIENRIKENLHHLEKDAFIIAKNYSKVLTKSFEAKEVINELLDDKILSAARIGELYQDRESNILLNSLSERLNVDEIYFYDTNGKVIYTNIEEFIDWQAPEGHPVSNFKISGEKQYIEEIRKDTVRGLLLKYGYYRLENGNFYQIGVKAENIQDFVGTFEIKELLDQIYMQGLVEKIAFYDNQKLLVAESGTLSFEDTKEDYFHSADVPVTVGEEIIGTLSLFQSVEDFKTSTNKIIIQGSIIFLMLLLALLWVMRTIYYQSKRYYKLAYFDQKTGFPNYDYLVEYLNENISENEDKNQAIFLISLRNIKKLNLAYGFKHGEEIISELSKRFKNILKNNDQIFKYNVDQFAIVVDGYNDKNDLLILAEQIVGIIEEPFSGTLGSHYINPAIGVLELKGRHCTTDTAINNVFHAMTQAKVNPYINFVFFDEKMEKKLRREDKIERILRKAIKDKDSEEFYLEYQPKLDLKTNKISGFEALARLKTEELGQISPFEFIKVAEKSLIITDLGNKIYYLAHKFTKKLANEGFPKEKIAINISGIQLAYEDFPGFEIKDDLVEFEITESVLLDNFDSVNEKLSELRNKGIKIYLDDFGTGFSSLARLNELNIDTLKIDKYFIDRIGQTDVNKKELIIPDIISMAHKTGLNVVAEGVETEEQKEYLLKYGCDLIQGYYYSKPLSEEAAIDFLKKENGNA